MSVDFSQAPYFDDYDEAKAFLKVLFKPEVGVQVRELNQMQSIQQNQLSNLASHIFKHGSRVSGAVLNYSNTDEFVKVVLDNPIDVYQSILHDGTVTGDTSGVVANLEDVLDVVGADPATLYVRYISAGTDNVTLRFLDSETLTFKTAGGSTVATGTVLTSATGQGSSLSITKGVFYINGYMVNVENHKIYLNKYDTKPTYVVGLSSKDAVVSIFEDESLFDNSLGTVNENAPGADRFKISLTLSKKDVNNSDDKGFINLFEVNEGIVFEQARSSEYDELGDVLAERTFEESGDYIVQPYELSIKEHLDDTENNGVYTAADGGVESKYVVELANGLSYIKGFRIENAGTVRLESEKSRDIEQHNNLINSVVFGNYINIDNIYHLPNAETYDTISLRDAVNATPGNAPGTEVGLARVRVIEPTSTTAARLYLFDVVMNSGKTFNNDVKSLYQAGADPFTADVVLDGGLAIINGVGDNSLLFKLPSETVQTVRDSGNSVDTSYEVIRRFDATIDGSGNINLNAASDEIFLPWARGLYSATLTSGVNTGTLVDLNGIVTLSGTPTGKSVVIAVGVGEAGETATVYATLSKTAAQEKTKTLQVLNKLGVAPATTINLDRSDVYSFTATDSVTSEDVTNRFILDTGQRDNFYGQGKINLISGQTLPTNNLDIVVNYFQHGVGDYFSVDSYTGVVDYADIPEYVNQSGESIRLSDVFDFRPSMDNLGVNFTDTGSDRGYMIRPNSIIRSDYRNYLPRVDLVVIDKAGVVSIVNGISSSNPTAPERPTDSTILYYIYLSAYVLNLDEIAVREFPHKRYRMEDINKLENRIENLENESLLNQLERETSDLQILDGAGLDRFKSGFFTDSMNLPFRSDWQNSEFSASFSETESVCSPSIHVDFVDIEKNNLTALHEGENLIMLPFTEEDMINQPLASDVMNINPFAIFRWPGNVTLTPSSDSWVVIERRPDVVTNRTQVNWSFRTDFRVNNVWGQPNVVNNVNPFLRFGRNFPVIQTTNVTTTSTVSSAVRNITTRDVSRTTSNDRVVSRNEILFSRERPISFSASNLHVNTRFYVFYDGVDVTEYCRPDGGNYGDALISDANGDLSGIFTLPDGDNTRRRLNLPSATLRRFRTGEKVFKLTSDIENNGQTEFSWATAVFDSNGVLETRQRNIVSTRTIDRTRVTTRTTTNTSVRNIVNMIDFNAFMNADPLAQSFRVKDEDGNFITRITVYFSTKDDKWPVVLQIRPMENGIPTGDVVPLGEVILPAADVNISSDGSVGTDFVFPDPLFLPSGTEFCFVLLANSIDYNVYIATMGEVDILSGLTIAKQPHVGVLFQSQNSSTWTELQLSDIKFKIQNAVFTKDTVLSGTFKNKPVELELLDNHPLESTNATAVVKVNHKKHAMQNGDSVTLSGCVDGNGILATELNATHTISNSKIDSYEITVTTVANATGSIGGNTVQVTKNIMYDSGGFTTREISLPRTRLDWGIKTTSGKSLSGTETPYVKDSVFSLFASNQTHNFNSPRVVSSNVIGADSLEFQASLSTELDNISPVIDKEGMIYHVHNFIVDDPDTNDVDYKDDTNNDGTSKAKYITKPNSLKVPANSIRVLFDGNVPQNADFDVFMKISKVGEEKRFSELPYIAMAPSETLPLKTDDENIFSEYSYTYDGIDDFNVYSIKVVMRSTNSSKVPKLRRFRAIALAT